MWHTFLEGREALPDPAYCYANQIDITIPGPQLTKADGSRLAKLVSGPPSQPAGAVQIATFACPYCGWRMRTGALLCFCCERPFAYSRLTMDTVTSVGLNESRLDELCSMTMARGGPPVEAHGSRGLPTAVVGGGGGLPSAAASSAVAAPVVAFAAVAKAEAIAGFAKAVVAPVVSIGASSSSGSGGPPPAVAAGASGSGGAFSRGRFAPRFCEVHFQ